MKGGGEATDVATASVSAVKDKADVVASTRSPFRVVDPLRKDRLNAAADAALAEQGPRYLLFSLILPTAIVPCACAAPLKTHPRLMCMLASGRASDC